MYRRAFDESAVALAPKLWRRFCRFPERYTNTRCLQRVYRRPNPTIREAIKWLQYSQYHAGDRQLVTTTAGVILTNDPAVISMSRAQLLSRITPLRVDVEQIDRTRQRCLGQGKLNLKPARAV